MKVKDLQIRICTACYKHLVKSVTLNFKQIEDQREGLKCFVCGKDKGTLGTYESHTKDWIDLIELPGY